MSKQHRDNQKDAEANLEGPTARHTDKTPVPSVGAPGNEAPGKERRSKQG
jgi:hypothetical protein